MRRKIFSPLPALVLLLLFATAALAQSGGTYNLEWNTLDGGGATFSTGGAYALGGTAGQPDAGTMTGGAYTLNSGFWNGIAQAPTATELVLFTGRAENTMVTLEWITSSEVTTQEFNLWRSASKTGEYLKINRERIAAQNSGGIGETHYTYRDEGAAAGKNFYKLESVETGGASTWSDAVRVDVQGADACASKLEKPTLTAPKDKARLKKARVTLKWHAVECATSYKLVVRREAKKGQVVFKEKNLTALKFRTQALGAGKAYYWQVSACGAGGCRKSAWQSFEVKQ